MRVFPGVWRLLSLSFFKNAPNTFAFIFFFFFLKANDKDPVYQLTSLFFKTPFPGWISIPTSFVSLFIFYIFSYLLSETIDCLSGCLMSSASIQNLFCGIFSAFKYYFNEFVGGESGPSVLFLHHLRTTSCRVK